MVVQILIHSAAVFFSFLGILSLFLFSRRLEGKEFFKVTHFTIWGIFFAVFVHSIVELLEATQTIDSFTTSWLMNILLIVGSLFFAYAGKAGLDLIKD